MWTRKIYVYLITIIERYNKASIGKYTKGLGQEELSFTYPFEDVNSLALTGSSLLI
jgi:3-hydroxy-3-methylglutaryl CoA synthase